MSDALPATEPRLGRFSFLTVSLGAYIFLLFPLRIGHPGGGVLFRIVFTTILLSAVYACARKRRHRAIALLLALPALALNWADTAATVPPGLLYAELALGAAFLLYTAGVIVTDILRAETITYDTISGAVAAYLLIGVAWSFLYGLTLAVDPSAIQLPEALELGSATATQATAQLPRGSLLYFSFVTLTTLGYGDILPVSPAARSLATLEAVVGQIYLAVLIARLVGLNISQKSSG